MKLRYNVWTQLKMSGKNSYSCIEQLIFKKLSRIAQNRSYTKEIVKNNASPTSNIWKVLLLVDIDNNQKAMTQILALG